MADISVTDITETTLTGNGVFDVFMRTVEVRLQEQFRLNRIKGTDYANVYLGAMESAMQQSIAFVLGEQAADKQADLIQAQIEEQTKATERADAESIARISLLNEQIASEAKNNALDGIIDKQVAKLAKEITLLESQNTEVLADTSRKNDQSIKDIAFRQEQTEALAIESDIKQNQSVKDLLVKQANIENTESTKAARDSVTAKELLLKDEQILNTQSEYTTRNTQSANDTAIKTKQVELTSEQIGLIAEQAETQQKQQLKIEADKNLVEGQLEDLKDKYNANPTSGLNKAIFDKTKAEEALTLQRKASEEANISDAPTSSYSDGKSYASITGVLGKQIALLAEKLRTEEANTRDEIGTSETVKGVVGKQKEVYDKQAKGFKVEAEQKLLKLVLDSWTTYANINDLVPDSTPLELGGKDIASAGAVNINTKLTDAFENLDDLAVG